MLAALSRGGRVQVVGRVCGAKGSCSQQHLTTLLLLFFSFGLVSDLSLPPVCWQTTAGPSSVLRSISCCLPACRGGKTGRTPPARTCFPAASCGAADCNPSTADSTLARTGSPGICLDTYLGTLRPAREEESKVSVVCMLCSCMCGVRKGKRGLGLSSVFFTAPQQQAFRCHLPPCL